MPDEAFCTAELWPLDDFLDICPELNRGNRVSLLVRSCLFQLAVRLQSPLLGGQPGEALVLSAWLDPADADIAALLWDHQRDELGIGEPRPALDGNKLELLAVYTGDLGVAGAHTNIYTVDLVNDQRTAKQFFGELLPVLQEDVADLKLLVAVRVGTKLMLLTNSHDPHSLQPDIDGLVVHSDTEHVQFTERELLALNGVNDYAARD